MSGPAGIRVKISPVQMSRVFIQNILSLKVLKWALLENSAFL